MEYTDVYNLPCLGEDDYPAVALHMQNLAELIEAELIAQQAALDAFLEVGSVVWTNTAVQVIPLSVTPGLPDVFERLDFNTISAGSGLVQPVTNQPTLPPMRGWFYIGCSVNVQAVGATTANSRRILRVQASTLGVDSFGSPNPGSEILDVFDSQILTSSTAGGDYLLTGGTVYSDGLGTYRADALFFHDNTASALTTTLAPAIRLFIYFLGDSPDIRQVQ